MQKPNKSAPAVFYVGMALLCLMLITSHMMSGLYARYVSTAEGKSISRVAKFEFDAKNSNTQTQDFTVRDISPKGNAELQIELKNSGEVNIECIITVQNLTGNLPISDSTTTQNVEMGKTETVKFDIKWQNDDDSKKADYMNKTDLLRITVTAKQVD